MIDFDIQIKKMACVLSCEEKSQADIRGFICFDMAD
jgi:hypothetical protein